MTERARWRPTNLAPRPAAAGPLLRVTNALGTDGGGVASLYLFGPIDEWGEECGAVSASEFIAALNGIQAGRVDLHVNSPGGSAFEALTMRAALVAHPAVVDVYVDGLAASAASVLITAARRTVMSPGSMQMVHRASSLAIGNSEDMLAQAALLEKVDRDIAGFYLARSGKGTVDSWLSAMSAETWYSSAEAVEAGLADEVAADPERTREQPAPEQPVEPAMAAADHWILATYRYAPAPLASAPEPAPVEPVSDPEPEPAAAEVPDEDATPDASADDPPKPAPSAALDDEALSRLAEQVAERLAPLLTPAASGNAVPETPAAPAAAAPPPVALPTAGPTPESPPVSISELIRSAVRKASL